MPKRESSSRVTQPKLAQATSATKRQCQKIADGVVIGTMRKRVKSLKPLVGGASRKRPTAPASLAARKARR
jgi:hypothetical protein